MNILFDNTTDFDLNEKYIGIINAVVCEALRYENLDGSFEISFCLVDNDEIRQINKKHRGIDKPTDVLSFPQIDFKTGEIPLNRTVPLGDIIISADKLKEQAKAYNHSIERELAFLTAHSMLHLLGYDHMSEEEENIMFSKQEEILNNIGITRGDFTDIKSEYKILIEKAAAVLENSYSPYSNFKVAAALACKSGKIYTGVNIENISYPAGICAERTAISKAISEGEKKIEKIAIVSSSEDLTYPCGICRQVMTEFMDKNGEIILQGKDNKIKVYKLSELIPHSFNNKF